MQFSLSAATAVLAMAASALAQDASFDPITSPSKGQQVPAGKPFEIQWTCPPQYQDKTVKIVLIGGETQNGQEPREDVTASVPNSAGKFTWNVPDHPPRPFYGLKIMDVNNATLMQYSEPFLIVGGSGSASTSSLASKTASDASYATPVATGVSAPAVPTAPAVPSAAAAPSAAAPLECGAAPAAGSGAGPKSGSGSGSGAGPSYGSGSNATAPFTPNTGSNTGAAAPSSAANPNNGPASNSYPGSNGAAGTPNNSSMPVTTGAAPLVEAGLLSVFSAVAAVAFSL